MTRGDDLSEGSSLPRAEEGRGLSSCPQDALPGQQHALLARNVQAPKGRKPGTFAVQMEPQVPPFKGSQPAWHTKPSRRLRRPSVVVLIISPSSGPHVPAFSSQLGYEVTGWL